MHVLIAVAIPALFYAWKRINARNYPPGPNRLPLLGNIFDIPTQNVHVKFAQFSKDLGSDIVYIDAVGTPFIILNSLEACNDLLEKRSNKYSSRFHLTMAYKLIDGRRLFAMLPYGDAWRTGRRTMVKHLSAPDQTPVFNAITLFVRKSLLPNLLMTPEDFRIHVRNGVGGSILYLAYGLPIKRVNDPWIALAEAGMHVLSSSTVPGRFVVDVIPLLQYIPEWFPGAGFQKLAKEWKQTLARFIEEPFKASKQGMIDGTASASFLSRSLEEIADAQDKEQLECVIENVGGMFSAGGTDTSVTAVINLIVVFLLFPDVQAKAQAEIDAVIGPDRLPVLEDKPQLPYLHAVVKEVLRWRPIVPTGLPHMTSEEDEYRGYFIPKGAIVVGNSWAIMNDEKIFPEPSKFDPSRFLTPTGQLRLDKSIPDPEVIGTFGYGRRICPGINIGLASVWLSAACILSCFNITPEINKKGELVRPEIEYLGKELVAHPEPFRCRITPRSNHAVNLIREEYDETSEYII